MSITVNGTNGLTFNDGSSQQTAASGFGFKNRIINGAMMIDQRNAGASVTPTTGVYTLDRWVFQPSQASKMSVQQSTTVPVGFKNSTVITTVSPVSVGAADFFVFSQFVEGFNVSDLGWGTANAQSVTISFQVRSSLTGTFGGSVLNSAQDRSYPFTYTISSANTWETKTITILGDTSGTWLADNGVGLRLRFGLGVGSTYSGSAGSWASGQYFSATGATSVVGTNGATFYITGVQLEKGSTATSFDYRPFAEELQLCMTYYEKSFPLDVKPAQNAGTENAVFLPQPRGVNSTNNVFSFTYKVQKRAHPTVTLFNTQANNANIRNNSSALDFTSSNPQAASGTNNVYIAANAPGAPSAAGDVCSFHWTSEAEL